MSKVQNQPKDKKKISSLKSLIFTWEYSLMVHQTIN